MADYIMCPYFRSESHGVLRCDAAKIEFRSREVRRSVVYPYCASANGWRACPLARAITKKSLE